MSPSTASTEADIIFSRASVALAKSQRLIASWLPPRTEDELRAAKTDEEIEREEQELFTPVPELLGLGAPLPQEIKPGDSRRTQLASNDRLRKQLLGQELARLYGAGKKHGKGNEGVPVGSKPLPATPALARKDDTAEEEEGGRSSLGKSKRTRQVNDDQNGITGESELGLGSAAERKSGNANRGAKRTGTYLDEVLAEKERKRQRKKKKKNGKEGGE